MNVCKIGDCALKVFGHGWCSKHYYRWKRHGTTDDPTPTESQRFWRNVDKSGDCWLWTGGTTKGYGQFWLNRLGRSVGAHRWAYEESQGPIPPHLTLDHRCHTEALAAGTCGGGPACPHRACVRPAHLTFETRGDNSLLGAGPAGVNARKTHCGWGHEFTPENTHITPDGHRRCRACERRRARIANARRKAERYARRATEMN